MASDQAVSSLIVVGIEGVVFVAKTVNVIVINILEYGTTDPAAIHYIGSRSGPLVLGGRIDHQSGKDGGECTDHMT